MKKTLLTACLLLSTNLTTAALADAQCDALAAGQLSWHTGDVLSTDNNCTYEDTTVTQPYHSHLKYTLTNPTTTGCAATVISTVYISKCGDGPAGDENYLQGEDTTHKNVVAGQLYKKTGELRLVDTYQHLTLDAKSN